MRLSRQGVTLDAAKLSPSLSRVPLAANVAVTVRAFAPIAAPSVAPV